MVQDPTEPVYVLLDNSHQASMFSRAVRRELRGLPKPYRIPGVPYPVAILICSGHRLSKDAVRALADCAECQTGKKGLADLLYHHFF